MMQKVISKGYTISITSWENDGDNYNTKVIVVDSKEKAFKINKICTELFISENSGDGVGNSMDGDGDEAILNFYNKNIELFPELESSNEDHIIDYFRELGYNYLGGSECYDFRVCQNVNITFSPEDAYAETVIFSPFDK